VNRVGKRLRCETCGGVVLCSKPGAGTLACCGRAMVVVEAKALPASD